MGFATGFPSGCTNFDVSGTVDESCNIVFGAADSATCGGVTFTGTVEDSDTMSGTGVGGNSNGSWQGARQP